MNRFEQVKMRRAGNSVLILLTLVLRTLALLPMFGLIALQLWASTVFAEDILRPQSLTDFGPPGSLTAEVVERVEGVENAYFDYIVLRRDFTAIAGWSDTEIAKLMNWNLSFIGANQKELTGIRNTKIPTNSAIKSVAYRPETWIRSAILPISLYDGTVIGYVDVKGFGHGARSENAIQNQLKKWHTEVETREELKNAGHSDGLMSLGEAIAEATRQTASQKLFDYKESNLETVETYGILKLPFNILRKGGEMPAALYVRSINEGLLFGLRPGRLPVPADIYTDRAGGFQRTRSFSAIDFGGVMITDSLLKQNFVGESDDPQASNSWKWAHEVATAYSRNDNPDKDAIRRHMQEMLAPLTSQSDFPEKSRLAEKLRQKLRAAAKRRRAIGMSYADINDELLPLDVILKNILSLDLDSQERAMKDFVASLSARSFNRMLSVAQVLGFSELLDPYIINKRLFFIASDKATSLETLIEALKTDDYFKLQAIGKGLAENPRIGSLLKAGLGFRLNKFALESFASNYVTMNKEPSEEVHRFLMAAPEVYRNQYLETMLRGTNNFPWAWKKEAIEITKIKNVFYINGIVKSSTTPSSVIETLSKSEDPLTRQRTLTALIEAGKTSRAFVETYLNERDSSFGYTARLSLALRDAQDPNILQRVKGFGIPQRQKSIVVSCENLL